MGVVSHHSRSFSAILKPFHLDRDRQSVPHMNQQNLAITDLPDQQQQEDNRLLQCEVVNMRFVAIASLRLHLQRGNCSRRRIEYGSAICDVETLNSAEAEVLKEFDELLFRPGEIGFVD
jgi:hypothetical protein